MSELILSADTGEELTINMGPQHPSTHGVIRFIIKTDGEILRDVNPDVGYLHRAIEGIAEKVSYEGFLPYTDRIDYVAAMTANHAWALAVEKLCGVEVPERAEWLRVVTDELNRMSSHMVAVGSSAMDVGAFTPFIHAIREREYINDLFEELCGARLTYHYHRVGGVAADAPPGWRDRVLAFLDRSEPILDEYNRLISTNPIFVGRLANLGVISGDEAKAYGLVGPNLRGSGVDWDLRRDEPYSVYEQLKFAVPLGKGTVGAVGDSWDRYWVRCEEWRESIGIVRQALDGLAKSPPGHRATVKKLKPKAEAFARVEAARGDMAVYIVGDAGPSPHRVHFRTGSYSAMQIIREKSRGMMIADLVAFFSSLDVVAPEVDR